MTATLRAGTSFPEEIHLNTKARDLLAGASHAYKHCEVGKGKLLFCEGGFNAQEYAHLTYYFLYILHNCPQGDPEYGQHAFFNLHGKTSSIRDRFEAIDLTLELIENYEHSLPLPEPAPSWWEQNRETILTTVTLGGAVVSGIGMVLSLIRGVGSSKTFDVMPGHVVVGGGHADSTIQRLSQALGAAQGKVIQIPRGFTPGHVAVGGGHEDSYVQRLSRELGGFPREVIKMTSSSRGDILLCKSENRRGRATGSVEGKRDEQGKEYVEGKGKAEMQFDHKNGNKSGVQAEGEVKVDKEGNVSGRIRLDYYYEF